MFYYLRGKVVLIETQHIVVEVQHVGYEIYCPNPFVFPKGEEVTIYVYPYVREDAIRLYGFKTSDERKMFAKLINVSGIGPKGALAILASGDPIALIKAIEEENEKFLMKFPGVGKKTARQIILDLKGKLNEFTTEFEPDYATVEPGALNEVKEALKALGYSDREISKVLPKLDAESAPTDVLIKKALQILIQS